MKKILHEPLLHFLLLGAMIFAAYGLMAGGAGTNLDKIVLTRGQLASMSEGFTRTRQRTPSHEEVEGLIRQRVQEEVYYREALALGLDRDDVIVRRRLQQKMEFVSEGHAAPAEPSDADLQAYLEAHAATFAIAPSFSFRQVYLDPQRRGANLTRDAGHLLARLSPAGARIDLASLGDRLPLERDFANVSAREVGALFGEKFALALGRLSPGAWQGPVESGYGAHLVLLTERVDGADPALVDVHEAVRRAWSEAQRRELSNAYYQSLLRKYVVIIESPSAAPGAQDTVAAR